MNKYKLLRLFLSQKKSQEKGISLIELIVALVISGIVLTMAASGFVNILRANQDVESKTVRNTGLQKALAFIQEDLKGATAAIAVTKVSTDPNYDPNCTSVNSQQCLRLDMPDGRKIYYGYNDISSGTQIFLKPGILQRQVYIGSTAELATGQTSAWEQQYTTIADGLINTSPSPATSCTSDGVSWANNAIYGADSSGKGGFRFCLNPPPAPEPNRLVRVFLYGRTVNNNSTGQLGVNIIGFARGQSRLIVNASPNNTSSSATVRATWTPVSGVTYSAKSCTSASTSPCDPSSGATYTSGNTISANLSTGNVCFLLTTTYSGTTTTDVKCAR